ncbi:MAG: Asp-tRNA(Asn)/Glu-tRNA(Gln) amidotransferase GatCAB subunit C [Flavobacteriales bacterium]|jgi:aspartyl-tRNA(Asn)/glutamyl-tRNA(Gln) amidotransferase subunit C|nr:Asp-tRNA(Asn)/Glu-tRNA(Gln) amidotransferase GatCAB subunit C [Flavobacteriales bacterium]|tara:strand:- start:589 stop:882 length:294 start_codon:yes stop_codon:yes gene_type:complete
MKINENKIKKLADLSQLNLESEEVKNLFSDLKKIIAFINKLEEVDTTNIEPLSHIHPISNIYREDIACQNKLKGTYLDNSKNHNSDYFKVPKVIKKQ